METADEFHEVIDGVYFWQAYEPAVRCDLSSCAVRLGNQLIIFDPIALAPKPLIELVEVAPPAAIVLTNGNHARASAKWRQRFDVPIFAHADAAAELGLERTREIVDGEEFAAGFTGIALPGAAPGEIAVYCRSGLMIVGDALIHVEPHGFTFLPDKYCTEPAAMRRALGKLLRFDFEVMTFAHGLPLVSGARQRLASLLS